MQLTVCAQEFEIRLPVVVEYPHRPAVWVVAGMTASSQRSLVFIVVAVTADAVPRGVLERRRCMALFTGDGRMQADQRKARHPVVEHDALAPAGGSVAALALFAFLSTMDVINLVAADARYCQLFFVQLATVTGAAGQLVVFALQGKVGAPRVVEADFLPGEFAVACLALFAVTAVVCVVAAMAADTGSVGGLVLDRVDMATFATDMGMLALQGKVGVPIMVEVGFTPFAFVVAVSAVCSVDAMVHVVKRVTAVAGGRRFLVALVDVAAIAGGVTVRAVQGEMRLVVIEAELLPAFRSMAVLAVVAEIAPVRILFAVATAATGRGFGVFLARLVTRAAGRRSMRTFKGEVGSSVLERQWIEVDDIGVPTQVFVMTALAGGCGDIRQATMVAAAGADILVDRLVAVQTQLSLGTFSEAHVAAGTL